MAKAAARQLHTSAVSRLGSGTGKVQPHMMDCGSTRGHGGRMRGGAVVAARTQMAAPMTATGAMTSAVAPGASAAQAGMSMMANGAVAKSMAQVRKQEPVVRSH